MMWIEPRRRTGRAKGYRGEACTTNRDMAAKVSPGRHIAGYNEVQQQFHSALFTVRTITEHAKYHTNHAPAQWVLLCFLQLWAESLPS